ncbi:MAG: oligosaccharide flippase family protein [Bifidobacterium crudilactis]|jgi:O-antigen/teichoic acid export membrane protein
MRRGLILNLLSNVVFFVVGYVIHYFLGNTMSAASYGIVGTIMTVLDFEYMFLSNGARQSLSKELSLRRYAIRDVVRKSILFQVVLIAVFFSINFFGAPLFAHVLNDPTLAPYFRIAAFLVPANGLFVLLLGINDGLQRFSTSALLSTIYPIAKLCVIPLILLYFQDDPVAGMEVGYLLALVLVIVLGCVSLYRRKDDVRSPGNVKIPFGLVIRNTLSFSIFFIMVSLVLSVDTLIVKSLVVPAAMAGYYTGAVNFGKLSYYLMTAFFTVILPVVAKAIGEGDRSGAALRVKQFMVLVLSLILPIPVVISASSANLLSAFYHPEYAVAAEALSYLSLSSFFMGMTVMLNMVHTSFSSNRFSDLLSVISLISVIPIFVACAKTGGITYIALASMVCTFVTMLVSLGVVVKHAGNVLTARALWAVCGSVALWFGVKAVFVLFPITGLLQIAVAYTVIYGVYVAILVLFGIVKLPAKMIRIKRRIS